MQVTNSDRAASLAGAPASQEAEAQGFLVFDLGEEEYAIDIRKVQELRGYEAVTRIANAPDYVKGVINLRGIIVPVIDMRIKFALGVPTYDAFTVVIILNVGSSVVGMVVDGVSDVVTLRPEHIKSAPEMRSSVVDADYLLGIGTIDQRMLIMVDIDKLMTQDGFSVVEKVAA